MNKGVKRIASLFLAVVMLVSTMVVTTSAADVENVGALLDSYTAGSGTFTVTEDSRIYVVGASAPTGDLLQTAQLIQREMRAQFGGCFGEMVWGDADWALTGDVVLVLDADSGTGADGYKLNVTGTTATVTAADTDGLIYGANTLMKCFRAVGGNAISGFTAADTPDTAERTVSLDCGRKYLSAEWIKNFIRQMSWMGYNTLQLHFSDDGGFRIDLWDPEYFTSANGNDFSWLAGSAIQTWVNNGNKNNAEYDYRTDPDKGKHLTAAQLVDICKVAQEYHIEIIPSFDSPSHMDYITWRYEQYANSTGFTFKYDETSYTANSSMNYCINYTGMTAYKLGKDKDDGPTTWPCYTTIDITDGTVAKAFVFALYEDIADFFKQYAGSTKFSVGADEVNLTTSSSVYPRKWTASAFPGYINDLNELLNDKNYTMRMYNDFMGSISFSLNSFDDNIEIQYWDSPFDPNSGDESTSKKAASSFVSNGRTLYNCIQTHTYYVLRVANTNGAATKYTDARNPANRQWTFYHSTEDLIYNEWVPNNVSEKGDHSETVADIPTANLGGAYFLIWNDYPTVSTEAQLWNGAPDTTGTNNGVTYYLLDRMASNIIKMWNWDVNETVDYDDFATVRATFGNFPGFTSCSAAANLPVADAPTKAVDHTELTTALANKISNADKTYTDDSYEAYETAYAAAAVVNADKEATEDDIKTAIANLTAAKEALVKNTTGDGDDDDGGNTGDGGNNDSTVNTPTLSTSFTKAYLKTLIRNAFPTDTDAPFGATVGWDDYKTAVGNANTALNGNQDAINSAVINLLKAENTLATPDENSTEEDDPAIISVSKISSAANGSYVTLKIVTNSTASYFSASVNGQICENETIIAQGKLQKLKNNDIVKVWLVKIPVTFKGEYGIEYDGITLVINP